MVERADDARTTAVRDFAARLRDLRDEVGTPSFRELAGRSQAISHTTLHEAAQGHRLPSWATTVEFVKACGADPEDYREHWQRADDAVRAATVGAEAPEPTDEPDEPEEPAAPAAATDSVPGRPWSRRCSTWALAGAAVVVAAAGVVTIVGVSSSRDDAASSESPLLSATASGGVCPLRQSAPPSEPPATDGDRAVLIVDVTLPDCSPVGQGQTVVKTWRFKNTGTVPWRGYSLHRVDLPESRDQCQTIADIAVPDTEPGEMVDVSASITTPTRTGLCAARFKFEDGDGRVAFPGNRPVYFQLVVT